MNVNSKFIIHLPKRKQQQQQQQQQEEEEEQQTYKQQNQIENANNTNTTKCRRPTRGNCRGARGVAVRTFVAFKTVFEFSHLLLFGKKVF